MHILSRGKAIFLRKGLIRRLRELSAPPLIGDAACLGRTYL